MGQAEKAPAQDSNAARSAINLATVADAIGAISALFIGGGLVWFFLDSPDDPEEADGAAARVAPWIGPGGAGASATVRF
jgi:hypothetical protein